MTRTNDPLMEDELEHLLHVSRRVAVLTGAGASTESGVVDFKSLERGWRYPWPREEMMSSAFLDASPKLFWRMWRECFDPSRIAAAEPGPFHRWLAAYPSAGRAEHFLAPREVLVVTQNVDGLHQRAGQASVVEVHGTARTLSCVECGHAVDAEQALRAALSRLDGVPVCSRCDGDMRPDAVLFGDPVPQLARFHEFLEPGCELFVVAGTRLGVHPVSTTLAAARAAGVPVVWVGDEEPARAKGAFAHRWLGRLARFSERFDMSRKDGSP